jgi:hypothetical protein
MHLPLRLGGAPDETERFYRALRSAVGVGGSARDESGIDGLWRRSRAFGFACGKSAYRRAVVNGWPHLATDLLPYYERRLSLSVAPGTPEAERRATVAALWPTKSTSIWRDIETALKRIDNRFELAAHDDTTSACAHPGRYIAPHSGAGEGEFGGKGYSDYAYYTTRFELRISFPVTLTNETRRAIDAARRRLRIMLPSFWSFRITTGTGFILGVSPLGFTAMTSNSG